MRQLNHGSLFAGIGGFDLGFERAGIKTVWQVEIDPFCRKVLERHFPDAERFEDVRTVTGLTRVDVISGGFPCQDISNAGKRAGLDGERSGLWREYLRIVRELRPNFVVVENVSALLHMGLGRVLGGLAACGYDAEWDCLPAVAFGAPHIRDRIWILAYPVRSNGYAEHRKQQAQRPTIFGGSGSADVADADKPRLSRRRKQRTNGEDEANEQARNRLGICRSTAWDIEPDMGRVADGIPARVDRLKGLGNAVVPQIAEWIGKRIISAAEKGEEAAQPEGEVR